MSDIVLLRCKMCGVMLTVEPSEINIYTFCPRCGNTNCLCISADHVVSPLNDNRSASYRNVAPQNPTSRELIIRGVNHLRLGNIQQAWQAFTKVTEIDPMNYRGWLGYFIAEDYRSYRTRLNNLPELLRCNDMDEYHYNLDEVITKWRTYLTEDSIYRADPNRVIKREIVHSLDPNSYYLESANTDWETDICCLVHRTAPDNIKNDFRELSFRSNAVLQTLDNLDAWISVVPSYLNNSRRHKKLLHFLKEAKKLVAQKRSDEYNMQSPEEYYKYLES